MRKLILIATLVLHTLNVGGISAANPKEPPTRTEISSPPVVYGDTYNLGTFQPGKEAGFAIENYGKTMLELDRIECSVPGIKCKVLIPKVKPAMIVGGYIGTSRMKPIGKFKAKVQVFWKEYEKPTVFYITGNCVK